jgi:biopolymer transport protein ExbD
MQTAGGRKRLITEINMVPFIDIVLVLLIIFMILSPFLAQSQIKVNLPKASTGTGADSDDPVKLQITRSGDFYLGKDRILRNQIEEKVRAALGKTRSKAVLIEADRDTSFKTVVLALEAAEKSAAAKVGVAVYTEEE